MIAELKDIDQRLQEVLVQFPNEVVAIRYSTGHDWSGDPAIFFRILLSDSASQRLALADVTRRVESELFDHLELAESDYTPYFNFRSKTEQTALKDPEWQ